MLKIRNKIIKFSIIVICFTLFSIIFLFLQDKYIGYKTGWLYETAIAFPENEKPEVLSFKKFLYNVYKAKLGNGDAAYNIAMHYMLVKFDMEKAIFWLKYGYNSDGSLKCLNQLISAYNYVIINSISNQKYYISELTKVSCLSLKDDYLYSNIGMYIEELEIAEKEYKNILLELRKSYDK